jgi:hypothetical protein
MPISGAPARNPMTYPSPGPHGQIDGPRRRTRALEHVGDEVGFFALRVYRRQDGDDRLAFHLTIQ